MQNSTVQIQNDTKCHPFGSIRMTAGLLSCLLIFSFSIPLPTQAVGNQGTLIVKIKSANDLEKLQNYGEPELLFNNIYRIRVINYQLSIIDLYSAPWVEFVERDQVVKNAVNAADPLFILDTADLEKQWYLPKIKIHQAWEVTTGSNAITVAVIDTGINARHEDLNDGRVTRGMLSYCQITGPKPGDCLVRLSGDISPGTNSDDNGHGTIVAGLIGAIANNGKGIAGLNWNIQLMPIKALDSAGSGLASDVALGIRWAADNGARIINLSIGGQGLQGVEILQEAIAYAYNKGLLIVAAAGNDAAITGGNLNVNPVLPVCADGGQNMILGVTAVDAEDQKARFSNYGSNCIDIAAPGTGTFVDRTQKRGLVSTYYDPTRPSENDLYVYALGTSVAAPMVSGVAALVMAAFPDLDAKAVRDRLIASSDNIDNANGSGCNGGTCVGQIGKGRLNAYKAVSTSSIFGAGTIIKGPDGKIYLVERGLKRPVSEFVFRQRFGTSVIVPADRFQVDSYSTGDAVTPADGVLVKEPQNPTVYLVEGGQRLALSYLAFVSRNLSFANVVTLPTEEVASYPLGPNAPVVSGVLMKAPDHPAVFILNNGIKQLLSFFVFKQRFPGATVVSTSLEELGSYPAHGQGYLYPPADGPLIRGDLNAAVFLIENGIRRGLSLAAFQNRGFDFANVKVLPQSEVDGYELGAPILE